MFVVHTTDTEIYLEVFHQIDKTTAHLFARHADRLGQLIPLSGAHRCPLNGGSRRCGELRRLAFEGRPSPFEHVGPRQETAEIVMEKMPDPPALNCLKTS